VARSPKKNKETFFTFLVFNFFYRRSGAGAWRGAGVAEFRTGKKSFYLLEGV
jgi:hypothetical protein